MSAVRVLCPVLGACFAVVAVASNVAGDNALAAWWAGIAAMWAALAAFQAWYMERSL